MSAVWEFIKQIPLQKIIMVIVLAVACLIAYQIIIKLFDRCIRKSKLDNLVYKILRVTFKGFLLFVIVIIILSSLGVSVSALVATLSVVGVAFSLAIQDFLGNVFGGFQIVSNAPFKVGDYVEAGGQAGSVYEVGLFYTKLTTPDKKLVQIPNSKIANDSIVNYSSAPTRRVEFLISVSYDDDVEKVRAVLLELINEHPMVIQEEENKPVAHVKEYRDNDILYTARAWCENDNYWTVYFDIMDTIKPRFEEKGISFSYPHVNVHMIDR